LQTKKLRRTMRSRGLREGVASSGIVNGGFGAQGTVLLKYSRVSRIDIHCNKAHIVTEFLGS
jgi:hypothetical protein